MTVHSIRARAGGAARHAARPLIAPAAIALLRLLGDCADTAPDGAAVADFIDSLPGN